MKIAVREEFRKEVTICITQVAMIIKIRICLIIQETLQLNMRRKKRRKITEVEIINDFVDVGVPSIDQLPCSLRM